MVKISTVTPVYSGDKFLSALVDKLSALKSRIEHEKLPIRLIECIFVIDECIDDSLNVLRELQDKYTFITIIELSKNYGQHPATIAGTLHTSGDWVVSLDEDLQHDPNHILPMLYHTVNEKMDICYADSSISTHNSLIRDGLSKIFKKLVGYLSGNNDIEKFNSFRLMRGDIARAAAALAGPNTYFDILLSWFTSRVTVYQIPLRDVRNTDNNGLKSGYTIGKLLKHSKNLLMSTKIKFIRMGFIFGLLSFLASVIFSIVILYRSINQEIDVEGWTSIAILHFFFGGIICLLIGIVLESITDVLLHSKGMPNYFIVDRSRDQLIFNSLDQIKNK